MKIKPYKHYRTRGGRRARVYETNCGGRYPIHGAIQDNIGWLIMDWTANGRCTPFSDPLFDRPDDLVAEWEEPKPQNTMNPLDQRIAIAESVNLAIEYCERELAVSSIQWDCMTYECKQKMLSILQVPDYLNDLDAMHEVEKTLPQALQGKYVEEIFYKIREYITSWPDFTEVYTTVTATASQRAEAYLRTIGKWKD